MSYETQFLLPRLGEGDGGGRVISWLKQPGETFEKEESLLEVETDKAVVEVPAPRGGRLIETIASVDDLVDFQDPVARVEFEGDPPAGEPEPAARSSAEPQKARERETSGEVAVSAAFADGSPANAPGRPASPTGERRFATPWARRLARQHEIDLSRVQGSGKKGRIVGDDVRRAAENRPSDNGVDPVAAPTARAVGFDVDERMVGRGAHALFTRTWMPRERRARDGVVLVHGLFADVNAWSSIATVLARRGVAVTAIDLPCHGQSASRAENFSAVVQCLVSTLEALGDGPFVLVGHSFGAAVAARAATQLARKPSALVLIAPAGLGTGIEQTFLDGMLNARGTEPLEREMRKLTARPAAIGREFIEPLRAMIDARRDCLATLSRSLATGGVQQVDIVPDLEALEIPLRIIHGRRDAIIPYHHALNAPPRAALHLLPEAGHMPQWESSGLVNDVIASLCSG